MHRLLHDTIIPTTNLTITTMTDEALLQILEEYNCYLLTLIKRDVSLVQQFRCTASALLESRSNNR